MKKLNILGVIPARAGSKGLKNKNILKLKNKSVIEYTIDQALASKYINNICVSTDSKIIQDISVRKGIWCDRLRPKKISGNNAKLYDAIEFITKNIDYSPDILVELHPTHVFRTTKLIDDAIKTFVEKERFDSLISILEVKNTAHPDYIIDVKKDLIKYKKSPTNFNRHYLKSKFQSSGIILITNFEDFKKNKSMIGKKCYGYVVKNEIEKIDINNLIDFEFCKFLLKYDNRKL